MRPVIGECREHTDENGERSDRTVIISPVRFKESVEEGMPLVMVVFSCNLGRACQNRECVYSSSSRR